MKTKAQIVQELLDKKVITAEDAVILLQSDVQYVPYVVNPNPWINPQIPTWPNWQSPFITIC